MSKLRGALIGCGRIGIKKHVEAFAANYELVDLVAVCDLVKEKAEKAAHKYRERRGLYVVGGTQDKDFNGSNNQHKMFENGLRTTNNEQRTTFPEIYQDYSSLLNSDIDFVVIATESGYHYKNTIDFLNAGKHVLVEKPMALSTDEMDEMIKLAKEKNLKLGVCFQNRFNPPIQELRKEVDNNSFGKIFHITARILWNRNKNYYKQAPWRGSWEIDGGTLMNQCSHNIDLLQWTIDSEVEELYAITRNFNHDYIEAEDFGTAILEFRNGSVGIIEGTANIYPRNLKETLTVSGEKGTVVIGGLAVNRIQTWRFNGIEDHPFMNLPDPETVYGNGHVPLLKDFAKAIIEDRDPYITGEEGRKTVDIILGMYKSTKEKKPVKFPLESFGTKEMEGTQI
ncbi:MAG: Gfo/Idh/MocA family protein [Petrotogales bacterium]